MHAAHTSAEVLFACYRVCNTLAHTVCTLAVLPLGLVCMPLFPLAVAGVFYDLLALRIAPPQSVVGAAVIITLQDVDSHSKDTSVM